MTERDADRIAQLENLAETVASTAHDELAASTVDDVVEFVREVETHLDREEFGEGAGKLLAFWGAYVRRELERTGETESTIAEGTIERFEQAFDRDVIGVDLYQALETLAIVVDMPEAETDETRLGQWAMRVKSLTEDFASHLAGHRE